MGCGLRDRPLQDVPRGKGHRSDLVPEWNFLRTREKNRREDLRRHHDHVGEVSPRRLGGMRTAQGDGNAGRRRASAAPPDVASAICSPPIIGRTVTEELPSNALAVWARAPKPRARRGGRAAEAGPWG